MPLPPDRLFGVLLPPLIFEAALQIRWTPFRREAPVILTLAFAGVVMAAMLVATGMHFLQAGGLAPTSSVKPRDAKRAGPPRAHDRARATRPALRDQC